MPIILGVTGNLVNDGPLTLTGSGFGTKALPPMFETMESGSFSPAWTSTKNLQVNATHLRHPFSKFNAMMNFKAGAYGGFFTHPNAVYQKWFVQYWVKIDPNFDWGAGTYPSADQFLSNIKIFRMWNPGSTIENFYVAYDGLGNQLMYISENIPGESTHWAQQGFRESFKKDVWHLLQFEFCDNTALKKADGILRMWIDGKKVIERTQIITRYNDAGFKRPYIIGFENEWGPQSQPDKAPNNIYLDDIYTDNTWTRFEIGTTPTYEGSPREIQVLGTVTDVQANFIFNQGQLPNGATVYGWFTDANGNRNTTGFPMQIGAAVPIPIPTPIPPPPVPVPVPNPVYVPTPNHKHQLKCACGFIANE